MNTENGNHHSIFEISAERTLFIDTEENAAGWKAFAYERGASLKASGQWENEICALSEGHASEEAAANAVIDTLKGVSDYKPVLGGGVT
ncbi:MAG: hypothetical protein ACLFR0_00620 [Alphaproteobacteria bacterium]